MSSLIARRLLLAGLLMIAGGSTWLSAEIVSRSATLSAKPGKAIYVPLRLDATAGESVAAISGQINFDASLFLDPEVQTGPSTVNFTVAGNEIEPGKVRFVLYANPTTVMPASGEVVFYLKLTAAGTLPADSSTTIEYVNGPLSMEEPDFLGQSSAATAEGNLIGAVQFQPVTVALNETGVEDWLIYE